eukprot:CAMPEP_0181234068 /NCGR_PEP_ID=MMETSP1096-20121128/36728_1 /TAXON_ID=156174 ORGANISM="Chrysochromulina ericina, Strain CCMP281" /NCGR_SAMPLE_ID=MMETSP1096 /ASSEMBLY_ACC=CAM_ASM_000453 /LENGTH=150 /DNA_ID=CAMNT_0023328723 /DNA_START=261 /DNA_END=709 /DNA_ORIENTATION=-
MALGSFADGAGVTAPGVAAVPAKVGTARGGGVTGRFEALAVSRASLASFFAVVVDEELSNRRLRHSPSSASMRAARSFAYSEACRLIASASSAAPLEPSMLCSCTCCLLQAATAPPPPPPSSARRRLSLPELPTLAAPPRPPQLSYFQRR